MEEEISIGQELTAGTVQKEPWEMTEEEFLASAERGRMHVSDEEDVGAVAEGIKPVAVIAYPSTTELPAMRLLRQPEIADKVEYRLFTHPGSTRTVAIIIPKGADLEKSVQTYINFFYDDDNGVLRLKPNLKETPESAVEEGKFYGYSQDDTNYYLNRNFGYGNIIKGRRLMENPEKQIGETEQEPELVQSDNPDLKPSGPITRDAEGRKLVGGWHVDSEGFYLSPPEGMDQKTWERYRELHRMGAFQRPEQPENPPIIH